MSHTPFLAAIIENPDDDTPRLVYADWLEDTCRPPQHERAEFIRLQCEVAATGCEPGVCVRTCKCDEKRASLRKLPRPEWFTGVVELFPPHTNLHVPGGIFGRVYTLERDQTQSDFYVARGFIERVECTLSDWLAHGPSVMRRTPLRSVTLTDVRATRIGQLNTYHFNAEALAVIQRARVVDVTRRISLGWYAVDLISSHLIAWAKRQPVAAER